jgi:hypothetical protein
VIELARRASWCWFGDSRAVYRNGRVYYGWVNADGQVWVAQLDPATGTRRRFLISTYSRTLATVKKADGTDYNLTVNQVDDHSNPSLVFRGGKLCVFYSYHAGSQMKYRIADAPDSVESFGPEVVYSGGNGTGSNGYTYPNPVDFSNGGVGPLYLFWRGSDFQPTYSKSSSLGGNAWSPAKHLFSAPPGVRPYVKVLGDPDRQWIHFAMTDGHPRDVATSIFYVRFQLSDGSFRRANGGVVGSIGAVDAGTPIAVADLDLVYDGQANPRAWIWDLQLDPVGGRPQVAFATVPDRYDHAYHVGRAAGTAGGGWIVSDVCDAGGTISQDIEDQYSGGVVLDPTDPSRVVVSRAPTPSGWQRLERWAQGADGIWVPEAALTDVDLQCVRPFFVRGAPSGLANRLMVLIGQYQTFVDFDTDLWALTP